MFQFTSTQHIISSNILCRKFKTCSLINFSNTSGWRYWRLLAFKYRAFKVLLKWTNEFFLIFCISLCAQLSWVTLDGYSTWVADIFPFKQLAITSLLLPRLQLQSKGHWISHLVPSGDEGFHTLFHNDALIFILTLCNQTILVVCSDEYTRCSQKNKQYNQRQFEEAQRTHLKVMTKWSLSNKWLHSKVSLSLKIQ